MSTYVYGFIRSSHPLPVDGLTGVGAEKPPLRLVRHNGLTAVVSDAPEGLRAKRRDLEVHELVLETLGAAGTVLPMAFGMAAADDDVVRAELIAGAERYAALLARLDGRVELNVKGTHQEEALLLDILRRRRDLWARNAELRAAGGGSQPDKIAFGELVAAAADERRGKDAEQVIARLAPYATQVCPGPVVVGCFINVSFLVDAASQQEFAAAVERLRDDLGGYAELLIYGPLPPYSFVTAEVLRVTA